MDLASIYFGIFLAVFAFTQAKVVQQTRVIWRHRKTLFNAYLLMIWVEAWVNFVFALTTYLFLNGFIPPSLGFYVGTVILWAIQTQLLLQIVANRVSLIMVDPLKARNLKWCLFLSVGAINIAVAVIWITAQMPGVTPEQVILNIMFEKAEKAFFLVVDLGLNLYFLYLVRFRLISDGLSKYWTLLHFNAAIVLLSTSMDCCLLGFLSLPDPYLYVQFAPVAYIVKLHIELSNASLIAKVVRSGSKYPRVGMDASNSNSKSHGNNNTDVINPMTSRAVVTSSAPPKGSRSVWEDVEDARGGSSASDAHLAPYAAAEKGAGDGIVRTVETMVVVDTADGYHDKRNMDVLDV